MRPQTHIALIPDGHGPYDSPSAGGLRVTGNHQAPGAPPMFPLGRAETYARRTYPMAVSRLLSGHGWARSFALLCGPA